MRHILLHLHTLFTLFLHIKASKNVAASAIKYNSLIHNKKNIYIDKICSIIHQLLYIYCQSLC